MGKGKVGRAAKAASKLESKKLKKKARRLGEELLERARSKRRETRAVLAICNRCGKAREEARELASWLQGEVEAEKALRGQLVIQRVGCMGPCPKKKLTVAVGGAVAKDWREGFLVDPDADRRALLGLLVQRLAV